MFFLSSGQSHIKHTKTILITEKDLVKNNIRNEKTAANIRFVQLGHDVEAIIYIAYPGFRFGGRNSAEAEVINFGF